MATRKDLLKAQSFTSRRMIAAFVDRDPDNPTPPLRRVGVATFVSVLLGVVLLAGTALFGMLRGSLTTDDWTSEDNVILSDTTSGMLFVYRDNLLYPMADVASARLLAGGAEATGTPRVIEVTTEALRGIAQQPEVGIEGAPRQLPAVADLESYPVRLCSTAPSGRGRYLTLEFGSDQGGTRDFAFVARASDKTEYLVAGGRTHELFSRPGESSGLAQNLPVVEPGDSWITALPTGQPINPIEIDGYGEPAHNSPRGLRVGQMAVVAGTDSAPSRYYVQLDAGLAAIAYLDMKLVQQQQGDDSPPVEISDAELAPFKDPDVESVSSDDIPMFELEGPTGYNSLEDASVCAVFSGDDPSRASLSVGQTTPDIPATQGRPSEAYVDVVSLPTLGGALLRNSESLGDDGAATLLLDGRSYGIPTMAARRALGYGGVTPTSVPSGLLKLLPPALPAGVSLDVSFITGVGE